MPFWNFGRRLTNSAGKFCGEILEKTASAVKIWSALSFPSEISMHSSKHIAMRPLSAESAIEELKQNTVIT